jgi:hypothetical protein
MTDLGPLFSTPPPAPPKRDEPDQAAELARVLSALERHIIEFLRKRIGGARCFHMSELLEFVNARRAADGLAPCAPDSPRRVMSELEKLGCCQVLRLKPRRASLYEVVAVSEEP